MEIANAHHVLIGVLKVKFKLVDLRSIKNISIIPELSTSVYRTGNEIPDCLTFLALTF